MNKKITLIMALFMLINQAVVKPIQGQTTQPFDLGITPTSAFLHVKPGDELTHTIIIKNEGVFSLHLSPHLVNFSSDQKTGSPIIEKQSLINILKEKLENLNTNNNLVQNNNPIPLGNMDLDHLNPYFSFVNQDVSWGENFTLKPGEEKRIVLKISPPTNEPIYSTNNEKIDMSKKSILDVEHHLTLIFVGSNKFSEAGTNSFAQVSGVLGSNMIVLFSEDKTDTGKLSIESINIPRFIDSFSQVSFSVLIKNSGKNATPLSGSASISNLSNQKLKEYIFYPDMVLSNSTRMARGIEKKIWEEISKKQSQENTDNQKINEEIALSLTSEFKHKTPFLFGIYNISIDIDNQLQTKKVVAFPISALILMLVALIIIIANFRLKKTLR